MEETDTVQCAIHKHANMAPGSIVYIRFIYATDNFKESRRRFFANDRSRLHNITLNADIGKVKVLKNVDK